MNFRVEALKHSMKIISLLDDEKICTIFSFGNTSLPLIFSGPKEKINSTFPYSGNLSSAKSHVFD